VIEQGAPDAAILRTAEAERCDLIVTGIARDELLGRFRLGTTVDRLLRRARVPLLVVKDRARRPYGQIVVATDLSEASRHALEAAAHFFPRQRLTIFHAYHAPRATSTRDSAAERSRYRTVVRQECRAFLQGVTKPAGWQPPQVLIDEGAPDALLRDYVRDREVDLVVLGTHGRSGLLEMFLGSVAKQIMNALPCDALIVREPAAATEP
jgi:nucleotide-binding universal stress UspA family protein